MSLQVFVVASFLPKTGSHFSARCSIESDHGHVPTLPHDTFGKPLPAFPDHALMTRKDKAAPRLGLPNLGDGVGLRDPHFDHLMRTPPAEWGVDWFEIVSENFIGHQD